MSRTTTILSVGACVLVLGAFLLLQADSLATDWQPLADGNGRGGLTDPGLRQSYRALGLVGLCLGAGPGLTHYEPLKAQGFAASMVEKRVITLSAAHETPCFPGVCIVREPWGRG
jgi:hypothetical protein